MRVWQYMFPGFYVGGYMIVVAERKIEAERLVQKELDSITQSDGTPLPEERRQFQPERLDEVDLTKPGVVLLSNGDY